MNYAKCCFVLPLLLLVTACNNAPQSALNDRGKPKPEYEAAVRAAGEAGIAVTCDAEGEVTFLDFHEHPSVSEASAQVKNFPHLKMLNFSSSKLTDADLANLEGATELEQLGIHGTLVTDDGLQHVAKLSKLQQLNLTDTAVTDAGLAKLAGLTSLIRIDLHNTKVTDAGMEYLAAMKDLVWIQLTNTQVSNEAVAKLQEQFPDAQVSNETIEESNAPMLTDAESPDE